MFFFVFLNSLSGIHLQISNFNESAQDLFDEVSQRVIVFQNEHIKFLVFTL